MHNYTKAEAVKRYLNLLILLVISISSYAQKQYKPYFQQNADYTISVKLDEQRTMLHANETIVYKNNSTDTLKAIYFHLWPNGYKDEKTNFSKHLLLAGKTDFYFSDTKNRGYIDSLDFKVNGNAVKWETLPEQEDVCILTLNTPLKPGDSINIATPFRVKLPNKIFSRSGREGDLFQVAQWYPKPAVYDNQGWHYFSYLDQGEFYSEFGRFKVDITLPSRYVLAATGDLIDKESKDSLTKYTYVQDRVHDFAWFANPKYKLMQSTMTLPGSGREILLQAYYFSAATAWKDELDDMRKTVLTYTNRVGEYPYSTVKVAEVNSSSDAAMEYPTICTVPTPGSGSNLEVLSAHEIGHNWFYGILASNEREHPWMDEGMNSFMEWQYISDNYGHFALNFGQLFAIVGLKSKNPDNMERQSIYQILARQHKDQPIALHSSDYTAINYYGIVYNKAAAAFNYLRAYLGDDLFFKCLHAYYEEWSFKHPQPEDVQAVFEKTSGKKLDWFFQDVIKTNQNTDYSLRDIDIQREANIAVLKFKNKGTSSSPFSITAFKDTAFLYKQWVDGSQKKKFTIGIPYNAATKFVIDNDLETFELNRHNNTRYVGKYPLLPKLKLKFISGADLLEAHELYYAPLVGWNNYNRWMLGLAIYNKNVFEKKNEFVFAPMYSFHTKSVNGFAQVSHTFFNPLPFIQNIKIQMDAQQFSYSNNYDNLHYTNFKPSIIIDFKKRTETSTLSHRLTLDYHIQGSDNIFYKPDYTVIKRFEYAYYTDLNYQLLNNKTINPWEINVNAEYYKAYIKLSGDIKKKYMFSAKKSLDIRIFGGMFAWQQKAYYGNYNFRMSGFRGYQDYLNQDLFLGRSESNGILSQQFAERDGNFKMYTFIGQTNKWISTVNIETDLPGKLPLRLFADLGTYYNAKNAFDGSTQFSYDAGFSIQLFKKVLKIYVPLAYSSDIKQVDQLLDTNFWKRIRFVLDFKKANPFKMMHDAVDYIL